jgi:LacI family transcriptional regulator
MIDNFEATYKATQHLFEQGCQNIAFITLDSRQTQMKDRLDGYNQVINQQSLTPYVLKVDYGASYAKHVNSIATFLRKHRAVDALLFSTNYLATRGIEALNTANLKFPTDICVVAFDDLDFFKLYQPTITAISQPVEEMSKKLIDIILKKLEANQENDDWAEVVLPTKLIVRNSSRRSE